MHVTGPPKEPEGPPASPMAMMGLGFDMAVPVALLGLAGHWLDRWLGTNPWLTAVGLLLGMMIGFYNLWKRVVVPPPPPPGAPGKGAG